tara:strand:- start:597 stop:791 length:195 start_codon:yes stop_codon:yes gene_type:complete
MIKYAPKKDRRTQIEKHSFLIFASIVLMTVLAFTSFHNSTKRKNVVKNPNPSTLKTVSFIRSNR